MTLPCVQESPCDSFKLHDAGCWTQHEFKGTKLSSKAKLAAANPGILHPSETKVPANAAGPHKQRPASTRSKPSLRTRPPSGQGLPRDKTPPPDQRQTKAWQVLWRHHGSTL